MAERKRVKGKKPKETMRQRQQRLLREQRAARNKNVRTQKALPPKATTGGRRYSSGTASSRRAQAAAKQARAAQGTKGPNRIGQPAGSANRRFGADRVARSVRRAQVETAVRGAAKRLGRVAGPISAISTGAEIGKAMRKNLSVNTAGSGRGAGRRAFAGTKGKSKPKKRGMANLGSDYKAQEQKLSAAAAASRSKSARSSSKPKTSPKPKVKKGSGVSGVGPVASGRAYSVAKTGKSVSRQRVDELRAMRERSKKRQAEMKKKKK